MKTISTLALGAAVLSGAAAAAGAAATPAHAGVYYVGCTYPGDNHTGPGGGGGETVHNRVWAGSGCNGGHNIGMPCTNFYDYVSSQDKHLKMGTFYCAGPGPGVYVYSSSATGLLTQAQPIARLCHKCGSHSYNGSHYLSGYSTH